MKEFIFFVFIVLFCVNVISAITVDGYAFLNNQSNHSGIEVFDILNETFSSIPIGHSISDVKYNNIDNCLYISSYHNNYISVIDVANGFTPLNPISLSDIKVSGIFITPENKIFCSTRSGIEIRNLSNNQYLGFINNSNSNRTHFCYDTLNGTLFVSRKKFSSANDGSILSIDTYSNSLNNSINIASPDRILFDSINNQLFINCQNYGYLPNSYIKMDANTLAYSIINTTDSVLFIELAENTGCLYVTPFGYDGDIYEYSTTTNQLLRSFQTTDVTSVTKYNPVNNKLYVLVPYNFETDLATELWIIDCVTTDVTGITLGQYESYRQILPALMIDMNIDESCNKLYLGTGHCNLFTVQCDAITETKTYSFPSQWTLPDAGWKWLSFDILYPDPDDNIAETFLAPISDIDELDEAKFKPHSPNSNVQTISFFPPPPQNIDHLFTSPYGYKFHTLTDCEFIVTGQRCPAETTFPLFGNNQENWIGYFLEETQHIYDAFADQLDNLTGIRAQHWAIKNENGWPDVPYTLSPGDMVIAYCDNDVPLFTWNYTESREKYTVPESQDFTYEEEADYIPVFIELDPNDLPSEIGAYVDGECKGATVVQDTTAQICAYILENQGEDLEFEFSYGSREQNKQIKEYGICEPETSKTVKGTIQIDNSRDCYYVSFKDGQNNTPVPAKIEITNFPNPFNPETTLFFSLPNEQEIELTVYNLKGQKVRQLVKGQFPSGEHSVIWEGKDDNGKQVSSGLYFYKLITSDNVISKKMLLLK
ncbi:MAG: T9SS type A sorting domain-containing protein [Candidatus Cloacimonetes bacterium]|nr:T9SS type A sorting domain-containing protein [Candidatus Cloacimonadota bacterium]